MRIKNAWRIIFETKFEVIFATKKLPKHTLQFTAEPLKKET